VCIYTYVYVCIDKHTARVHIMYTARVHVYICVYVCIDKHKHIRCPWDTHYQF